MIKYFCDRCGKEMEKGRHMYTGAYDGHGAKIMLYGNPKHLCEECSEKLDAIKDKLEHEEDIFDMTNEEIMLLRNSFKVGDKVITSDGRMGQITDTCTCDRCKERGFYESTVDFGNYIGYITISDKDDGFESYYQIGDIVFGNLDEETVNNEVDECKKRLLKLYRQLSLIANLKRLKEMHYGN